MRLPRRLDPLDTLFIAAWSPHRTRATRPRFAAGWATVVLRRLPATAAALVGGRRLIGRWPLPSTTPAA
jgi:hypothetical protein